MEKVTIIKGFECEGYVLYSVKSAIHVNYGSRKDFICFDYANLANQLEISKQVLDDFVGCDPAYKQALFVNETAVGRQKLINADVVKSLLMNMRISNYMKLSSYDFGKEIKLVNQIIKKVKEESKHGKSKLNIG
ncbi:hypothetical protein D3C73_959480 [compost metagenome]